MKKIYILSLFLFCYITSFAQKFDEQVKSLTESIYDKVTVDPRKADSCLAVIEGRIAEYDKLPVNVKNATELSVLHAIAGYFYGNTRINGRANRRNKDVDYYAKSREHWGHVLDNKELLAKASAKDYKQLVELGSDGELFNHDMLIVMANLYMNYISYPFSSKENMADSVRSELKAVYKSLGRQSAINVLDDLFCFHEAKKSAPNCDNQDSLIFYWREMQKKYAKSRFVNYYINEERQLLSPKVKFFVPVYSNSSAEECFADKPFNVIVEYYNCKKANLTIREYVGDEETKNKWHRQPKVTGKVIKSIDFSFGNDEKNKKREKLNLPIRGKDTASLVLPAGKYVFVHNSLGVNDAYTVDVTSMKIVTLRDGDRLRCYVLNAISGKPVSGAKVKLRVKEENPTTQELSTNSDGEAIFKSLRSWQQYEVTAYLGSNDSVSCSNSFSQISYDNYYEDEDELLLNINMDRAIYRPGQKVNGYIVAYNRKAEDKYEVAKGKQIGIKCKYFYDDDAIVYNDTLTANDFGSVDFSFTLPVDAKVGVYEIRYGNKRLEFKVEEYKRPTWELTLTPQSRENGNKDAVTYGDTVMVKGLAMSYSGVPVQSGTIEYTLERAYQSYYLYRMLPECPEKIGTGKLSLNSDGTFLIPMPLIKGDNNEPCVYFTVKAKVTDYAGETHEEKYSMRMFRTDFAIDIKGKSMIDLNNEDEFVIKAVDALNNEVDVDVTCTLSLRTDEEAVKVFPANKPFRISDFYGGHSLKIPVGNFVMEAKATDKNGHEVVAGLYDFTVIDTNLETVEKRRANFREMFVYTPCDTVMEGKTSYLYFYPASDDVDVFVHQGMNKVNFFEHSMFKKKLYVLPVKPFKDEDCNVVSLFYVKNGIICQRERMFYHKLPEEKLLLSWSTFRNHLQPGQNETWKLTVRSESGKLMDKAEVLATMYDMSLDALRRNSWDRIELFRRYNFSFNVDINSWWRTNPVLGRTSKSLVVGHYDYDKFRSSLFDMESLFLREVSVGSQRKVFSSGMAIPVKSKSANMVFESDDLPGLEMTSVEDMDRISDIEADELGLIKYCTVTPAQKDTDPLADVVVAPLRSNFAETAFFYPHLVTDKNGEVEISFTLPESLTKWKFLGFAHDKSMNNGVITAEAVAQKTFMVQPQMPRFVRVGDEAMIPVRIINQGNKSIKGRVQMRILNARTEEAIKSLSQTQTFSCGADTTIVVTFPITATSSADDYICEVVAEGNVKGEENKGVKVQSSKAKGSKDSSLFTLHSSFSDGERNLLPVLPSRVKLTESVPFYIDNASEKTIDLSKVYNGNSSTAEEKTMSIEYTANPVWTVVEALRQIDTPESPSAPSLAASVYANSMLLTLDSKLSAYTQKPVVNRDTVNAKLTKAMKELKDLQCKDGGFRWFSGFDRSSYYITLLVAEQLVKAPLPPKGAAVQNSGDVQELKGSKGSVIGKDTNDLTRKDAPFGGWGALLSYLDSIQVERYEFNRANKIKTVPSESDFHYLYVCSMTPERKVSSKAKALRNEMLSYIETHSQELSIYGLSASSNILRAFGRKNSADKFLNVVRHYLVKDEGLGKHFESKRAQYSWYDYRIPTQVAAMEAFYAVNPKDDNLNDMTLWLLRQKQVQSWDNPANTVNVCDLLLKMNDSAISLALLTHDSSLPRMSLNGKQLTDKSFVKDNVKKDSLYFAEEIGYMNKQVSASLAENAKTLKIQRNNAANVQGTSNSSISWGAVTVTFTEESNKLNTYTTGEVRISRRIMVEDNSSTLPKWRDLSECETLKVGQKVRVRHTLHTDRDMDYVCVKTLHPACFEPVDKLSGYQWKGGEGCYQSIHDSYIEMFFQTYHEGTSTLDIDYYVTRSGTYNMGITSAECTYAPMYGGHSDGMTVRIIKN